MSSIRLYLETMSAPGPPAPGPQTPGSPSGSPWGAQSTGQPQPGGAPKKPKWTVGCGNKPALRHNATTTIHHAANHAEPEVLHRSLYQSPVWDTDEVGRGQLQRLRSPQRMSLLEPTDSVPSTPLEGRRSSWNYRRAENERGTWQTTSPLRKSSITPNMGASTEW